MYRAKALGKNRHEVFDVTMHQGAVARLTLETDLRHGLAREEFVVHYQPILSLTTRIVVGFEALLRWQRADGRRVPPAEFIGIAEETGQIVPLGTWVLNEACQQIAIWQRKFPSETVLTMAVNVSARQLEHATFVDDLALIIRKSGLVPGTLHLELTESALMDSSDAMLYRLRQLKELGAQLYLDDFGTGYSSLSYLHRFPLDTLRSIGRSSSGWKRRSATTPWLEGIVSLAKKLGMGVIAEGVETRAELRQLQEAQCGHGQGFLFSPPADAARIEALLRRGTPLEAAVDNPEGADTLPEMTTCCV